VALQITGLASVRTLNELLIRTQPAHIQLAAGQELEQRERNVIRANYVRSLLDSSAANAVNPN
jgi:protein-arginine kinase